VSVQRIILFTQSQFQVSYTVALWHKATVRFAVTQKWGKCKGLGPPTRITSPHLLPPQSQLHNFLFSSPWRWQRELIETDYKRFMSQTVLAQQQEQKFIVWPRIHSKNTLGLRARSQSCEKRLLALSCLYVRLSAWNKSVPTGWNFIKFYNWIFRNNLSRKFKFH
jgi:hypothetical protein